MSGLVERLRAEPDFMPWPEKLLHEAANEIERLTARVAELEVMLRECADEIEELSDWGGYAPSIQFQSKLNTVLKGDS